MPPEAVGTVVLVLAGGGGSEPVQQTEQHTETAEIEDSGWFHHFMHHGRAMITAGGMVAVALIGAGVKLWLAKRK